VGNPLNIQQEGNRLLDVGQEEVHDEDHELVVGVPGLAAPSQKTMTEEDEESQGGEEGKETEERYGRETCAN